MIDRPAVSRSRLGFYLVDFSFFLTRLHFAHSVMSELRIQNCRFPFPGQGVHIADSNFSVAFERVVTIGAVSSFRDVSWNRP